MKENQSHNKRILKSIRKKLRNNPTSGEDLLWQALKGSKLEGRKFRRQHSIGKYVVDFYCPSENLILEVDGDIQQIEEVKEKDLVREKYLIDLGFKIVRIQNDDVFRNLTLVLNGIIQQFSV